MPWKCGYVELGTLCITATATETGVTLTVTTPAATAKQEIILSTVDPRVADTRA